MASQTELPIGSEDSNRGSRGQMVGYVRVSSADQNPGRQHETIGPCDRVFEDRMSGKSRAKRKGLADLIGYVREGDTVRVASLDRLGRDTRDLHALVDELTATLHARFPVTGQVVPGPARQAVGDAPELLTKASSKVGEAVLAASMARSEVPTGRSIDSSAEATVRFISDAEELLGRAREILAKVEAP